MARRVVSVAVLSCVTLGALGCSKAKLEATLKGYKPGSPNVVLVHVKGDKGASVRVHAITDPSGASRGSSSGRITLYDETAIAYDRVTGKKLAERVFQAPKICDQSIKLTSATTPISDQQMHPLRATVATWAATVR